MFVTFKSIGLWANFLKMFFLIIEIPKEFTLKGCWVEIVAENWIRKEILYLPDCSYSQAYKKNLLVSGAEPDVETWEQYACFKVIHRFGKFKFQLQYFLSLISLSVT